MSARWVMRRQTLVAGLLLALGALWLVLLLRSYGRIEPPEPTAAVDPGWYSLYFTEPVAQGTRQFSGGPDAALAQAIDQARYAVDVAVFELDLWSVRDALLRAQRRGLSVRVVTESDNLGTAEMAALGAAGIPVRGDLSPGLMHHKFVVLDRLEVCTGSMNFTLNGAYRNNNNLICIRSAVLAKDYLHEFEEMYSDQRFGPISLRDTPSGRLTIEGVPLEVHFAPEDRVLERLLQLLHSAEHSVHFLAFTFTSDALADAMLHLAEEGIEVAGVLEAAGADGLGSEFERLHRAGLDLRLDGNPNNMHHKVLLIDGRIVVTGSYNFSRSAEERNDENVLIVFDSQLAAAYEQEFQRLFAQAQR